MSNWLGYDSNDPWVLKQHVPHPEFVWRYGNGLYKWPDSGLFPGVRNATIDVIGDDPARADELQIDGFTQADINSMIDKARPWVGAREHIGPATVYVNRSNFPAVAEALSGKDWWLHLATLDGSLDAPSLPWGCKLAAIQAWGESAVGFHADLSLIVSGEWYDLHRG